MLLGHAQVICGRAPVYIEQKPHHLQVGISSLTTNKLARRQPCASFPGSCYRKSKSHNQPVIKHTVAAETSRVGVG